MTSDLTPPLEERDAPRADRTRRQERPVSHAKQIELVLSRWRAAERELEDSRNGARPELEARVAALREEYRLLTEET
jgi:hypothetical protein